MSRLHHLIEGLLLPIIALTALVLSLADVFGFLPLFPLSRIPALTLSIVSLILTSLLFIQRRSIEIHEQTQHLSKKILLEQIDEKLVEQIDPELQNLVEDNHFLDLLEALQLAINESKLQLNSLQQIRHCLISILHRYPRATFLCTQSPATFNLWEDKPIKEATAKFTQSGGKIEQYLFVKDSQELASQKIQDIKNSQEAIGVQMHIVISSISTVEMKKNLFVESKGRFACEIYKNNRQLSATITTNKQLANSYRRIFEKL